MLGNFGVFSFMRSWKLTRFFTTCLSATSFKIWTFSRFLCISETAQTNFFLKSLQIIFIMYIMYIPSTNFEKKEKKWWSYCFVSKPCFRDFQFAPWLAGYPSVKLLQCYTQVYLPKISFLIERLFYFICISKDFQSESEFQTFFLIDWMFAWDGLPSVL